MSISQKTYSRAKQIMPGGVQLLSKRPEMFAPEQWPNYAVKGKGAKLWDMDGNAYYDMTTNGIGACLLGYADPDVSKAAALATIDKMEKTRVWEHAAAMGDIALKDWADAAKRHGVNVKIDGVSCLPHVGFTDFPLETKTLYTALMLKEGFLAQGGFYPTLAHNEKIMAKHREANDKVFSIIADTIKKGGKEAVIEAIGGPVCQSGFQRLNG